MRSGFGPWEDGMRVPAIPWGGAQAARTPPAACEARLHTPVLVAPIHARAQACIDCLEMYCRVLGMASSPRSRSWRSWCMA